MLSTVMILAGCSKNEGEEGEPFTPPAQEQLTQNAYADNENTGGGFSFTADAPWTATVDEVKPQAPASVQAKSVTRAAGNNGNNVVWLKLYNGDKEAYSGGAGTITLRIEIDQNYTGERREATITIRSGNNTFTVTVVQEGTKARRQRERAAGQSDEDYPRQNRTFVGSRSQNDADRHRRACRRHDQIGGMVEQQPCRCGCKSRNRRNHRDSRRNDYRYGYLFL